MEADHPEKGVLFACRFTLVNDMLADMCGLIVKTIALIPAERDEERLSACAFVLDQINEAVERMVNPDRTEH